MSKTLGGSSEARCEAVSPSPARSCDRDWCAKVTPNLPAVRGKQMGITRIAAAYVGALYLLVGYLLFQAYPEAALTGLEPLLITALVLTAQILGARVGPSDSPGFLISAAYMVMPLVLGVPSALWVACISTALYALLIRQVWWRALLYMAHSVLAVFVTGSLFVVLGGEAGIALDHPFHALVAGCGLIAFSIANIAAQRALLSSRPSWSTVLTTLRETGPYLPLSLLVTIVAIQVVMSSSSMAWLLIAVALFALLERAHNRFATSQNQLSAVLNATRSAIVTVEEQTIRIANEKFGQLVGRAPQALAGVRLDALPRTGLVEALAAERPNAVDHATNQVVTVEGAEKQYFDWYVGPVIGREGETQGTIEILTEVTAEKKAEENLRQMHHAMLRALTAAIDARDAYTHGHSSRVSEYAVTTAHELGLPEADCQRIGYSALLHDIGKLGIDDRVLRKHGPLTPNERAIMMTHPVIGAQVLEKADVFTNLIPGVRWHHEWVNGGGYPDGLKGDQIPLDARIICAADAFDAMTSDRPYRRALPPEEALARLRNGKAVQFDAAVVEAFEAAFHRGAVVMVHSVPVPEGGPDYEHGEDAGIIRPVHGKELDIVYQVSKENYARLNVSAVLRRFLEIFYDSIRQQVYMIFLVDEHSGDLTLHSSLGHIQDLGEIRLVRGQGIVGKAAETGKPVLVQNVDTSDRYIAVIPETRAELAVPLLFNNQVVGILNVESGVPHSFTGDDLYLFEALAQQVASALELARYHERIAFAVTHDGLTGVLNHYHFYERLTEEVARARRYMHEVSVAVLDLSGLKALNDTHGHMAGDRALIEYARTLRNRVREVDIVARYGGDEFAIIMPETGRDQALCAVENLLRDTGDIVFHVDGRPISLPTATYGVAAFPEDADRATELVAIADRMMYASKPGGRTPLPS